MAVLILFPYELAMIGSNSDKAWVMTLTVLHEKFLQFIGLEQLYFSLILKYLHVKIANL